MRASKTGKPTKQFPESMKILNSRPYGMSFEDYKIHLKHQSGVLGWYLKPKPTARETFFNNNKQVREKMFRENTVHQQRKASSQRFIKSK